MPPSDIDNAISAVCKPLDDARTMEGYGVFSHTQLDLIRAALRAFASAILAESNGWKR